MDAIQVAILVAIGLSMLAVYLAPTLVASMLKRKNLPAIAAVNLLLGWTLIGWVGAFVWACVEDR